MFKTMNRKLMKQLRDLLLEEGLKTKVVSVAKSGSCYVAFHDVRMGKIRIGNHNERERYGYRWQIRHDAKAFQILKEKGHKQFIYPPTMLEDAVAHMKNYHAKIRRDQWNEKQ